MKDFTYEDYMNDVKTMSVKQFLSQLMENYNEAIFECEFRDNASTEMGLATTKYATKINILNCLPMVKDNYKINSNFKNIRELTWKNIFSSLNNKNDNFNLIYLENFAQFLDIHCFISRGSEVLNKYELDDITSLIKYKRQIESNLITLLRKPNININGESYSVDLFDKKVLETIDETILKYNNKSEFENDNLKREIKEIKEIIKEIPKLRDDLKSEIETRSFENKTLLNLYKKDNLTSIVLSIIEAIPTLGPIISASFKTCINIKKITSLNKKQLNAKNIE